MGKIEGQPVPPRPLCDLTARTGRTLVQVTRHGGVADNKTISELARTLLYVARCKKPGARLTFFMKPAALRPLRDPISEVLCTTQLVMAQLHEYEK